MRRTAKKIDPLVSSPRFLFPLLFWFSGKLPSFRHLSVVCFPSRNCSLSLSLCLIPKLSDSFWMFNDVFYPCLIQLLCIMALKIYLQIFKKEGKLRSSSMLLNPIMFFGPPSCNNFPGWNHSTRQVELRGLCVRKLPIMIKNMQKVWLQEPNVIFGGVYPLFKRLRKF